MGLELKGWSVLAKEGEPSLRFVASQDACGEADLFVAFPWALSNVISGSPGLYQSTIVPMRHVAEYRNYHWQHSPDARQPNRKIHLASGVAPYPKKSDATSDAAAVTKGGNFGRIARTGILDDYIKSINQEEPCGIPAQHWRSFFKILTEGRTAEGTTQAVEAFAAKLTSQIKPPST